MRRDSGPAGRAEHNRIELGLSSSSSSSLSTCSNYGLRQEIPFVNDGDAPANNVSLVDNPDETFVASIGTISDGGSYDGDLITWALGTINPGDSVTVTYVATLNGPGGFLAGDTDVINTATVDSDETDPSSDPGNVVVTAVVTLGLSKGSAVTEVTATLTNSATATATNGSPASDSTSDDVVAHTQVTYTLTVTNSGDADGTSVALVDTLPEGITVIANPDGGKVVDDVITWNLGTVAAGASTSVSVTVQTQ